MIQEGQIVLFTFPQTNQAGGNLRPALVVRSLPGAHDDWLICMISSKLHHEISGIDEVVREADTDFAQTGLKTTSLIRVTRVAVVEGELLEGNIGTLAAERFERVRANFAKWLIGEEKHGRTRPPEAI